MSMTREELIARLRGYEWSDFECKKARRAAPKDAYSNVSAFANTQGGWLLSGVSEAKGHRVLTGADADAFDRVQDAFLTTLRSGQKINRIIVAEPHVHEIDEKRILAFFIPESGRNQKPVYLNGNPRDSFIRRAARDERMTDNELQRFLRDAAQQPWDSEALPDFEIEPSIDTETLSWYQAQFFRRNPEQRQIEDPLEFLQEWNFATQQRGKPVLTRAAILLFGQDRSVRALLPRPVLDYQRIDTRFEQWSADARWHDRMVFEENLFKTWRGLVAKYARIAEHPFQVDPATLRRNDDPPDYIAFREATINLLIHQDYGDHNRKAVLKWFTDRIQFWNPGDAFATPAQLLESNEKEIRNPLIVNAFRRIGLSDQAGTGIRAILRNWRELGRRPPQINNDKGGKSFELVLQQEPLINDAMQHFQANLGVHLTADQASVLALAAAQDQITAVDAGMVTSGNLATAHEVLAYLKQQQLLTALDADSYTLAELIRLRLARSRRKEPVGQAVAADGTRSGPSRDQVTIMANCMNENGIGQLMEVVGRSNRTKFRDQVLKPLLAAGWIEMTIPDKPTSSKQKYRLTEAGKHTLERAQ